MFLLTRPFLPSHCHLPIFRPLHPLPPPQLPPPNPLLNLPPPKLLPPSSPLNLTLLHHHRRRPTPHSHILDAPTHHAPRHPPQILHPQRVNLATHLPNPRLASLNLYLTPQILQLHHPRFQIHEQRALELVFRALDLAFLQRGKPGFDGEVVQFATHDFEHVCDALRRAGGRDAEDAGVGVGVVEGDAGFDPAVLVEHAGVEATVHAFAGAAGGEGAAAAKECLEGREGVDVGGRNGEGFEGEVDVGEGGVGGVGRRREVGEGEEAAGIVGGEGKINVCGMGGGKGG